MKGGQPILCGVVAWVIISLGGCAIGPSNGANVMTAPVAERDLLAEAARQVETARWPEPKSPPAMAWLTGGGGDRFSKSDAVDFYVDLLSSGGARFETLMIDASATLANAAAFHSAALTTAGAARVSMNDVARVEDAIQTLRQHRDIYWASAKELDKAGDLVDQERLAGMKRGFSDIISDLGDAADILADRVERDRSATYAAPDRKLANQLSSGL